MLALAATLVVCGGFASAATGFARGLFYPVEYTEEIKAAAERHGLDPDLVCAIIKCESSWDASAVSGAGAVGLMQVMPATAQSLVALGLVDSGTYDPTNLSDAVTNIEYGCAYLEFLQNNLSSTTEIVAAYNAGIGTVQEWLADGATLPEGIEYAETSAYLERVTAAYEGYAAAYPDGIEAE